MQELVHVCRQKDIGSILKDGLIGCEDEAIEDTVPGWEIGVNLTSSVEDFYRPIGDREVCLIIDCNRLDPARLTQIGGGDSWWWRYAGDLPAWAIIRIEQGKEVIHVTTADA